MYETNRRPSERIVTAVAAADDVSPLELEPRLGTVIDVDALNELVADRGGPEGTVRVSFRYRDHLVTACRDGTMELQ